MPVSGFDAEMNPRRESPLATPVGRCVTATSDAHRWFQVEVYSHEAQLKSYLRGSYPSVRDIDDVVQESYLRVWKASAVRPIASAKAFLYRVARNVVIDWLRREKNSPVSRVIDPAALPVLDQRPGAVEIACSREEIVLLAGAIQSLPARCREIIILRKLQGVPQKEIAARLGVAVPTVQVQVARGMKKIEEFMHERGVSWYFGHETGE